MTNARSGRLARLGPLRPQPRPRPRGGPTRRFPLPLAVPLALSLAASAACTLTHSLDDYRAGDDLPEADAGLVVDAGDAGTDTVDTGTTDAGDGCEGNPQILTPVTGATVTSSVRVTASAPHCISTMILYVDGVATLHFTTSAVDQDLPVAVGTHKLNINGWAGTAQAHSSRIIVITRAK